MEKRMPKNNQPSLKEFTFGTCTFDKTSPQLSTLSSDTKVLNVYLSFEDALKLSLAVSECVRKINSYKHSTSAGKRAALNLTLHLDKGRITVNEGRL